MLYSRNGKILTRNSKVVEKILKTLVFYTEDSEFPEINTGGQSARFEIYSTEPQNVTVDFSDGTVVVYPFVNDNGTYFFGLAKLISSDTLRTGENNGHVFTDVENNGNNRPISFTFEKIQSINQIRIDFCNIYSPFPETFSQLKNIRILFLRRLRKLTSRISKIGRTKSLTSIALSDIGVSKFNVIDEGFFNNTDIYSINISGVFNLSNPISSNFFRINEFKRLNGLSLTNSNIGFLPETFKDLSSSLTFLDARANNIINPEYLEVFINMVRLLVRLDPSVDVLFSCDNLYNVSYLYVEQLTPLLISQIPEKWRGLKSLSDLGVPSHRFINQEDFDLFIDKLYDLSIAEGFLDVTSTEAINTGFPSQFRDVSWGSSLLTQTGIIEAPLEFVQGESNGNPINQGQKIYVLVNNYGHNAITSGNFN